MAISAIVLLTPFVTACAGDGSSAVTPTAVNEQTRRVTVYDFARVHGDLLLYPATVTVTDSGDPVLDAVRGLFRYTPVAGHESLWVGSCAPGLGVRETQVTKQVVTIDVQAYPSDDVGNATCDLSVEGWNVQKQQLAWTVRTADHLKAPVRGTLDADYVFLERTTASRSYLASSH